MNWREELKKYRAENDTTMDCMNQDNEFMKDKLDEYESIINQNKQHIKILTDLKEIYEQTCKNQQDTINELKNKIEQHEITIDKMKCCENCGTKQTNTGECENNNRYMTNDKYKCINYDMWILKNGQ